MDKVEYYTVKLYNKYNWAQFISINKLDKENVDIIKKEFKDLGMLNQDNLKGFTSQINLREISYIEYKKETND